MRTHAEIIRAAGAAAIQERLSLNPHTVRSWAQRDSIPAEHWKAFVDCGFATLEELADAAASRSGATADAAASQDAA